MLKNKRVLSFALSFVLMLGLVLVPSQFAFAEEVQSLTIVHVNDVHGRLNENISYAKIKTYVDGLKAVDPNLLLLHAGDSFHGTIAANLTEGEAVVEVMNAMEFDAMTPGNHDFNFGYEKLLALKDMSEFDIIGANILKEDGSSDFDPYMVYEMENGLRVGVFGITTAETKYKSHPKNTEGIEFGDFIETGKQMVAELEELEVDYIVALVHLGIDEGTDTSYQLANGVEGIDLIVDGHSHDIMEEGAGELVNGALIVQANQYLENVGVVNVTFTDGIPTVEAKVYSADDMAEVVADEYVAAMVEELVSATDLLTSEVVGNTAVELDGVRDNVRKGETNLGNLITDAMLLASGADVALTNGGGIRASIDAGEITLKEILTSFPFTNVLTNIEVTGAEIVAALEHSVKDYPATAGHFAHVSGMKYTFDPNKEVGSRITEVIVGEEPIVLDKTYLLVTNDFLADGGDGYTMFKGKNILVYSGLLSEVLEAYIRANPEVDPEAEGRIVALPLVEKPTPEPVKEDIKYIVKPGDWLSKIGIKYNVDWKVLAEHNKLANPNLIFPNQVIMIPQ